LKLLHCLIEIGLIFRQFVLLLDTSLRY
jgi:hypothetical protein